MTTLRTWQPDAPLATGRPLLIEASAGTGKTWQMASLVARLVAEEGLPIDKILVITFTKAAAAELRDRVRRRLVEARDTLQRDTLDDKADPVLRHLWNTPSRLERCTRLENALTDFDRAPISTIHGFSQRTLDQLAFESGQEPGLDVMTDVTPLIDELVDDTLATLYTTVDETRLGVLDDLGFTRQALKGIAKEMAQAVTPELRPAPKAGAFLDPIGALDAWTAKAVPRFQTWLEEGEGAAALEALHAENRVAAKQRRFGGLGSANLTKWTDLVRSWLEEGAPRRARFQTGGALVNIEKAGHLRPAKLEGAWKDEDDPESCRAFPGHAFFRGCVAFFDAQDTLYGSIRADFAHAARRRLHDELGRRGALSYDTMLSRLADRIAAPGEGGEGPLAQAIRRRYEAALVDEFQDTDMAQWTVLRKAFVHAERRLIVVGDPKQAIYGFRGADVHVYLNAARTAGTESFTMKVNWRSDGPYVAAMNKLWENRESAFERDDLRYIPVGANKKESRFAGKNGRRPLELRWLDDRARGGDEGAAISSQEDGELLAAQSCAREATELLRSGATILRDEKTGRRTAIEPGDIAVLVRKNRQAELVRKTLAEWGVPAVTGGRGSVFQSPAARWMIAFLDALADPGRDRPARALATTPLFGWTAKDLAEALAAAGEDPPDDAAKSAGGLDWAAWIERIRSWAEWWPRHGFVQVWERALEEEGCLTGRAAPEGDEGETGAPDGLLTSPDGERHVTDLRHLAELCHAEERRSRLDPRNLAAWLRDRAHRADEEGYQPSEEEELRLESDAKAVQVVTAHGSKGLEYPVVLLPFAWSVLAGPGGSKPLRYHEEQDGENRLLLDLHPGGSGPREGALEQAIREDVEENARLLYVALTRAAHHAVAWLGPIGERFGKAPHESPLGRLALPAGPDDPSGQLDALAGRSEETIGWRPVVRDDLVGGPRWQAKDEEKRKIAVSPWPRGSALGSAWQVASYSSIVAGRTLEDADEPLRLDEQRLEEASRDSSRAASPESTEGPALAEPKGSGDDDLGEPAFQAELAGGKDVGTWVHAVFEHLDFRAGAPTGGSELSDLVSREALRAGVRDERQYGRVAAAVPAWLATPLDGGVTALPKGFRLCDIAPEHRLDELPFQLRLGTGNDYEKKKGNVGHKIDPAAVRVALMARRDGWPGEAWMRSLEGKWAAGKGDEEAEDRIFPAIAGIMTGFIDLTFRVRNEDGDRYYVLDYKTNRITSKQDRRSSLRRHYTQPWLAWAMGHSGYHLQALVYTLALHRMLKQRLGDGYDYERHVGGHLYLFLRGMEGAGTPMGGDGVRLGVWADRWPREVIVGFDKALLGASPEAVRDAMAQVEKGGAA